MFGTTKHSDMILLTGQDGLIRGKRGTGNRYATIKYNVIFTFLMQSHLKCSGLRSSSECSLVTVYLTMLGVNGLILIQRLST